MHENIKQLRAAVIVAIVILLSCQNLTLAAYDAKQVKSATSENINFQFICADQYFYSSGVNKNSRLALRRHRLAIANNITYLQYLIDWISENNLAGIANFKPVNFGYANSANATYVKARNNLAVLSTLENELATDLRQAKYCYDLVIKPSSAAVKPNLTQLNTYQKQPIPQGPPVVNSINQDSTVAIANNKPIDPAKQHSFATAKQPLQAAGSSIPKQTSLSRVPKPSYAISQPSNFPTPKPAQATKYSPEQIKQVALKYYTGDGVVKNFPHALKLFKQAAESGDKDAQFNLALMYLKGEGSKIDNAAAIKWLIAAANQGSTLAQNRLGLLLVEGQITEQNLVNAKKWFELAAKQGYPAAQYNLAKLYLNQQQIDSALELLINSANSNYSKAQLELGNQYEKGTIVPASIDNAINWYIKAGNHNNTTALVKLGYLYYFGSNGNSNYQQAANYFFKAAQLDNADAQYMLGRLILEGKIQNADINEASKWLNLAANKGNQNAIQVLQNMTSNQE